MHKRSEFSQKVHGIRAKIYQKRRFKEKATMRKTIAMHNERTNTHKNDEAVAEGAVPAYLLDREGVGQQNYSQDSKNDFRTFLTNFNKIVSNSTSLSMNFVFYRYREVKFFPI